MRIWLLLLGPYAAKALVFDWDFDQMFYGGVHVEFPAQTPAPSKSGKADRARRGRRST